VNTASKEREKGHLGSCFKGGKGKYTLAESTVMKRLGFAWDLKQIFIEGTGGKSPWDKKG